MMNFFKLRTLTISLVIPVILAGCQSTQHQVATRPAGTTAPLYTDLGTHHRSVTTSSPLAQKYFDQGLIWAFSFNHDEAIKSFMQAAALDPNCAMAYWGIALCNGPHINNPA